MPDYRPIPGQTNTGPSPMNLPTDDLSRMASERASNILTPYGDQFGQNGQNRPIVPSPIPGGAAPAPGAPPAPVASPSTEDKLYQSIHPDTFSKVLETIMQFVTGKPIPRQEGGPANPSHGYSVAEGGRPEVVTAPGAYFPTSPGRVIPLTSRQEGGWVSPYESPYEPGLPSFKLPTGGEGGESGIGKTLREAPGIAGEAYRGITGTSAAPLPTKAVFPVNEGLPELPAKTTKPIPTPGEPGWKDYTPEGQPTGIRYKMGPENIPGDEIARQGVLAEAGRAEEKYGIPIPRKSYYDVHPEERAAQQFYDMTRGPSPDSYEAGVERFHESNLMDIIKSANTTKEARAAATEQLAGLQRGRTEREAGATRGAADIYGRALEHGIGTPTAQEKLAHAEYLRTMPAAHLAGISEQGKVHLEGISRTVSGHLEAAKIAAEPKDLMMKEINATLIQGQKNQDLYGTPFDPQKISGTILRLYRAMGKISDEEWAKMPEEYKREPMKKPPFTEFYKTFQNDPRFKGKSKSELEKTYNAWNP